MKTLSSALTFGVLSFCSLWALAAPKYPLIVDLQGKVQWTDKDDVEGKLKPKQVLIEKAGIKTESNGQVLIQFDAHQSLRLMPNSHLMLPSISWETGEAPVVYLKAGSMRWIEGPGGKYNITLRSDLFELPSPIGDFVFVFDPVKATAEVKVIKGKMEFSAMNAEDSVTVGAGQKAQFQGVLEGGEIVYDILLKGKKIPRGKLGAVESFSAAEKKLYSEAQAKKEARVRQQKLAAEQKAIELARDPRDICEKPSGKLNQCAWICENNPKGEKKACRVERPEVRCLRKRCNANGVWAEETAIPKDKATVQCGAQVIVKECDY